MNKNSSNIMGNSTYTLLESKIEPLDFLSTTYDLPSPLQESFLEMLEPRDSYYEDLDRTLMASRVECGTKLLQSICSETEVNYFTSNVFQWREKLLNSVASQFGVSKTQIISNFWDSDAQKQRIQNFLLTAVPLFEQLSTPTIIYDRFGCIHLVNAPFQTLSNLPFRVPTSPGQDIMMNLISPQSLKTLIFKLKELLQNITNNPISPPAGMIFDGGLRNYMDEQKFVDGTFSLSYQRDNFGLPLVWVVNFLPRVNQPWSINTPFVNK